MTTRAIVSLGVGFQGYYGYCIPSIQQYAQRISCDFIFIRQPVFSKGANFCLDKFQIGSLLDRYEQICYIDSDVLVHPQSPNIFKLVNNRKEILARPETFGWSVASYGWHKHDFPFLQSRFGCIHKPRKDWFYFNAGVFVVSNQHKSIFTTPFLRPFITFHQTHQCIDWGDQTFLNYLFNYYEIPLRSLTDEWNFCPYCIPSHTKKFQAGLKNKTIYFFHYAGLNASQKLSEIKRLNPHLTSDFSFVHDKYFL